MDVSGLERIDSFPYRHRVAEVMRTPVAVAPPDATIAEAAAQMGRARASSVIVVQEGRPIGIVTERDVTRAVAHRGGEALIQPLAKVMSTPIESVTSDAFVYVALARMARLALRHLAVVDADGNLIGVVTAGALLKQRGGLGLVLADEVQVAQDAHDLAAVMGKLPGLARGLLAEGATAREVAAVISGVIRDITSCCADLSATALRGSSAGAASPRFACLILGSAGRGESLLVPDQDNALVHASGEAEASWFADFGRRLADLLDASGVPYCRGGVMVSEALWRHSLDGWRARIAQWVAAPEPDDLLNVDIFFDFVPVYGAHDLAAELRAFATQRARNARPFLLALAEAMAGMKPPFGLFGRLRTIAGRVDLKRGGLLPIVTGARLMALKSGSSATSTAARIGAAVESRALNAEDGAALSEAHEFILRLILEQQIVDIASGAGASSRVNIDRLPRPMRRRLDEVLHQVDTIGMSVRDVLSAR